MQCNADFLYESLFSMSRLWLWDDVSKIFCKFCLLSPEADGSVPSAFVTEALCNMWSLFTSWALFLLPDVRTWKKQKSLVLTVVGCWMSNCGRLWCCHREGRAALLSECVMQQPLPWMREKTDVWLKVRSFVLNVGGWWRWELVPFAFRNMTNVLYNKWYVKVIL